MYRVELKGRLSLAHPLLLVYVPNVPCGVESLLAKLEGETLGILADVPNVPCGVESSFSTFLTFPAFPVPNVPCGVESRVLALFISLLAKFLMYRVELKAEFYYERSPFEWVPNVPCGVESQLYEILAYTYNEFLMYRVELKVSCLESFRDFSPRS